MKHYPKYIKTFDGYIGTFARLDSDNYPVYRFEGGTRTADHWELEHGSDRIEDLQEVSAGNEKLHSSLDRL